MVTVAAKRITIQFQTNGEGELRCGSRAYPCLGKPKLRYPRDLTVNAQDKHRVKYSQEYVTRRPDGTLVPAEMQWAILIWGQRGVYIHAWPGSPTIAANGGPTAGCIHLTIADAEQVYNYVDAKTRVTINYPW